MTTATCTRSQLARGSRQVKRVAHRFVCEQGGLLGPIDIAYETWGILNEDRSNAILVLHALTGDAHVIGEADDIHPTPGWWNGLIGPGCAIDTDRYFVICPNVLGGCQGTTGPSSAAPDKRPYGSRFPAITIRDQVAAEKALADSLRIETFHNIIGGSMGGMRVLEWLVSYPSAAKTAVVIATSASASAEQIALTSLQVRMIRQDPEFHGGDYYGIGKGPLKGLRLARELAHLTYRSPQELDRRFGRNLQEASNSRTTFAVESYLSHSGDRLVRRFDANSYICLSEAMNSHDVGRGRGGIKKALARIKANVTVIGISSDRLFPLVQQEAIAQAVPTCQGFHIIDSDVGHDGFLLEIESLGNIVGNAR